MNKEKEFALVAEFESALQADNPLQIHLISERENLTTWQLLDTLLTAAALVYAELTEPKNSTLFKSLLVLLEFLQDPRLAHAKQTRFEKLK